MVALTAFIAAGLVGLHAGWGRWSLLAALAAWLIVSALVLVLR
jgi:hypothetical protein